MIDLGEAMQDVLDKAASYLTVPATRKFVSHGPPPFDCADQLTVHMDSLRASNPLTRQDIGPNTCSVVPVAPLVVTIVRCVPVQDDKGRPPTTALLTASSAALLLDLNQLWTGLVTATLAGTLVDGVPCSAVSWQPSVPIGPSGGYAAWQLRWEMSIG